MSARDDREAAQWTEARRWFAHVDEDLRAAEMCVGVDPPLLGPGAYHCQQAAEKLIKGLLIAAAKPFPKIHDLKDLANRAAPDYPDLADAMTGVRDFTVWGLAYRYPAEEDLAAEPPTVERVRAAIAEIRAFFAAARARDPFAR